MQTLFFNRIANLLDEIHHEKQADSGPGADPGSIGGKSTHPTATVQGDTQSPSEGFRSAENSKDVKESVPDSVDSQSDAKPAGVPTDLANNVPDAKATGQDASHEDDYKDRPEDKTEGGMGGTEHPAAGSHGEKYSQFEQWTPQQIGGAKTLDLCKAAAELGNLVTAEIAQSLTAPPAKTATAAPAVPAKPATTNGQAKAAFEQGFQAAQPAPAEVAADVIANVCKVASYKAELIHDWLLRCQKQAEEEMKNPDAGSEEGEEGGHADSDTAPPSGGEGGGAPPDGGLLAAMAGGGDTGAAPPAGAPGPGGGDLASVGGMGGGMEGGHGGMGGGMPPEAALQQLAMALMELGIDPAELAAIGGGAGGGQGAKIASAVQHFKRQGKFRFSEAKTADERRVRDFYRNHIQELCARNSQ